jgi:hypothetical protein
MTTKETKEAFAEFRVGCGRDMWGHTMGWWFAVADALTDKTPDQVPAAWKFRQSPLGSDTEQYEYEICSAYTPETLRRFGNALSRYANKLKAAGLDY